MQPHPRILIVGGGYVGMYTAMRLLKKLRHDEATVTVVDPRSYMTYQPFLPEAAAGSVAPRHVVVPLRRVLRGAEIVTARVTSIDARNQDGDRQAARRCEPTRWSTTNSSWPSGRCLATLPIPGLARVGDGIQDRRGSDPTAQPRAGVPRHRRVD